MTASETPSIPAGAAPLETIAKALKGYRILAWATGIWLIALTYEMIVKYVLRVEDLPGWMDLIAPIHGWVYFIYLLCTANLAVKVRWPIGKTIGILLAGTVPLVGIIVEHFQTKKLKAQFGL
ncbi:hypothetical protein MCHIJ_28410 [Mycolicibacterium chitae]|uniref:Integral membrane protein n=1 Tax=Mycolicibacterium chitae TaxID=1792 RepID=A0A448I362_MYCCI|nr:DUF3817 domain-containing protein [Mycolicibacterium chitae]MCV7104867.1 DUF3817 domain-containing protein [Mycolicibacterium chitae]BBZ03404.1 hypothetical protein MCHIJ_28410 [Mycolicibacterium chitae]VEG46911.1 integral membrane protein [Mycolicibacterium chitae]